MSGGIKRRVGLKELLMIHRECKHLFKPDGCSSKEITHKAGDPSLLLKVYSHALLFSKLRINGTSSNTLGHRPDSKLKTKVFCERLLACTLVLRAYN